MTRLSSASAHLDEGLWPGRASALGGRAIGVVYLCYFLLAISSELPMAGMVVSDDAAATARHILARQDLYRLALALGLASTAAYVAVTALFYGLFEQADAGLSRMAAFFSLTGCAVQAFSGLFLAAPLVVLGDDSLPAWTIEQRRGLAQTFIKLHGETISIALVFFGLYCLLLGYLIFRSGFLPRVLGVLMAAAGLGWLTFLWPPLSHALSIDVQGIGVLAEAALMVWLIAVGVRVPREPQFEAGQRP